MFSQFLPFLPRCDASRSRTLNLFNLIRLKGTNVGKININDDHPFSLLLLRLLHFIAGDT